MSRVITRMLGRLMLISTVLAVAGVLGFGTYYVIGLAPQTEKNAQNEAFVSERGEEPPLALWRPLDHELKGPQATLVVQSFSLRADNIRVLYSIVTDSAELSASLRSPSLRDDEGRHFDLVSNDSIGTALGVSAGIAVFKSGTIGRTLTFDATEILAGEALVIEPPEGWSLTFAENQIPGGPIDYSLNMLIAPEITMVRDTTIGKPGGAQVSIVKLLLRRGTAESAIYGVTGDGGARGLTEEEFQAELVSRGSTDMAPPPLWPSPVLTD